MLLLLLLCSDMFLHLRSVIDYSAGLSLCQSFVSYYYYYFYWFNLLSVATFVCFLIWEWGGGRRCFGSEPSSSFFLISRDFSFVVAVVVLGCDDVV